MTYTCIDCNKPRSEASTRRCRACYFKYQATHKRPRKTHPPIVRQLAQRLYERYRAQCKKMGVRADAELAEFIGTAAEMIEWERQHPGIPWLARYQGREIREGLVMRKYVQYVGAEYVESE